MTDERAEDVVIVKGPVHHSVVVVSFRGGKNAFVVMSEFNEVDAVAF